MYADWTQNAPMTGGQPNSNYDWKGMASAGLGGLGGMVGGMMSSNGYDQMGNLINQGMDSLNQNYDQGLNYLNPYQQQGIASMGQYAGALNNMGNSQNFVNNIMNGYQESPMAQFQSQEMQRATNNAAAAGGTLGSPAEQMAMSRYQQGITSQDQQRWMENNLGVNTQYLNGLQGLTGMGFNAAGQMNQNRMGLGDNIATMLQNLGSSKINSSASQGGGIGSLISGIAGIASFL